MWKDLSTGGSIYKTPIECRKDGRSTKEKYASISLTLIKEHMLGKVALSFQEKFHLKFAIQDYRYHSYNKPPQRGDSRLSSFVVALPVRRHVQPCSGGIGQFSASS
jgi:hypothetical protein